MRAIRVGKTHVAYVDDADYEKVSQNRWMPKKHRHVTYAHRMIFVGGKKTSLTMHRALMSPNEGDLVDHADRVGLNNQRSNLRLCDHSQNAFNRKRTVLNTSGFKGVQWRSDRKRWRVYVAAYNKSHYVGLFKDRVEAFKAYCEAARCLHGDFMRAA